MGLTPQDRLELYELYARYAHTFDGGDAAGFAGVFAPSGRIVRADGTEIAGRDALRKLCVDRTADAPGISHHHTNISVWEDAGGVHGAAYFLVLRACPELGLLFRGIGRYADEFTRDDDRWVFAARYVKPWLTAAGGEVKVAFEERA